MIDIPLLSTICEIPGTSGFEQRIRAFVIQEVTSLVDEVSVDPMGNVIALKKGTEDKRVMIGAHMDEIGFIVTHIDDEGFLRFHTLGGFDAKTLTAQRVIVHGTKDIMGVMGSKPTHIMKPEERRKAVATTDFFIDTGLPKEEVEKYVSVGNSITRERKLIEMGECVNCKSLDNRLSVYILLEVLRQLKDKPVPYDTYAVFTVQEEIGLRGASVAAHTINPHFGFGLDVTIAYDLPGSMPHEQITRFGKGTAIKIMDGSVVSDYRMVAFLKQTANENDIPWQAEILTAGGTDTHGIQLKGKDGSIAGAISIPTRYIHQSIEMAHKKDIVASIDLLRMAILGLDKYDWSFK